MNNNTYGEYKNHVNYATKKSLDDGVIQRITDIGYYYQFGKKELGPFTVYDETEPAFCSMLAEKLGVEPKKIVEGVLREIDRPTTLEEIADILGTTIRQDQANKLVLFCAMILTFTEEDQINILMSGESSGGKSYTSLEIASYMPKESLLIIARASPTAFFYDVGSWDEEAKALRIDLSHKILILLDQPHYTLLVMLRSLLSHDQPELLHKITDKSKRGELRTKNIIVQGYPTVVFCAAKFSLDEQERTRVFILSPESSQEKFEESLRLCIARVGDREAFKQWIDSNPRRRWLKSRVSSIKAAGIKDVIIQNQDGIYTRFRSSHKHLAPRHQRDLPRILSLIKAHALLDHRHREMKGQHSIIATKDDEEAGFNLYDLIARPNELGISPQVYEIYENIVKPLLDIDEGLTRKKILGTYREHYGRPLGRKKLEEEILPSLETAGLVIEEPDPNDRRRRLVYPPNGGNISCHEPPKRNVPQILGTSLNHHIRPNIESPEDQLKLNSKETK
ncbi:MAG: hypothetical protein WBF08_05190 [Candidatus Bathyarchaeia archaeon]